MSTLSKDQVKEIIKYNNFQSVADVSAYLRGIFKDIIQELLEAELEAKLGYAKDDVEIKNTDNSRTGYSPKTKKVNLENLKSKYQGVEKESLNPKLYLSISGMFPELKKKLLLCCQRNVYPGY